MTTKNIKKEKSPSDATKNQLKKGIRLANADIFRWEFTCKTEAPYPLNYLPFSENPQDRMVGIVVGLLIEKGMIFK